MLPTTMNLAISDMNLLNTAYYLPPAMMNLASATLWITSAGYFLGDYINTISMNIGLTTGGGYIYR